MLAHGTLFRGIDLFGVSNLHRVSPRPVAVSPRHRHATCIRRRCTNCSPHCKPSIPLANQTICAFARQAVSAASCSSVKSSEAAVSGRNFTTSEDRGQKSVIATGVVSRLSFPHNLSSGHRPTLPRREFVSSLCHSVHYTPTPAFRETAGQDIGELFLALGI